MGAKDQGVNQNRWRVIPRTICLVTHGEDILLLKRGEHKRVFPGKYNGLGGHIERNEDPLSGAIREIREESGLEVKNVQLRGIINIDSGDTDTGIMLLVYTAEALSRDFTNCDEGTLEWVPRQPSKKDVVEDLPILTPHLADKTPFSAHVHYDEHDKMVYHFA